MSAKERKQGERLSSRQIFQGRTIRLDVDRVRLPNGKEMDFEMIHHPGAAAVVPVLANGDVLLVRQYRYATGGWLLEVPAGKLDPGEGPETCAAREVEEETGFKPGNLQPLGLIWTTPGFTDEKIHLFAAFDLTRTKSRPEDDEVIEVIQVPLDEALAMIWRGELCDAKSALALIHAARHVGRLE